MIHINSNHPRDLGLFAILKRKSSNHWQPNSATINGHNPRKWSLFAVHFPDNTIRLGIVCHTQKQHCQITNSFICVQFFAYAVRVKHAHLTRVTRHWTIRKDWIWRQTMEHYTMMATCQSWRSCNVSIYTYSSSLAQSSSYWAALSKWAVFVVFALSIRFTVIRYYANTPICSNLRLNPFWASFCASKAIYQP